MTHMIMTKINKPIQTGKHRGYKSRTGRCYRTGYCSGYGIVGTYVWQYRICPVCHNGRKGE